jgi:hypothetical protein
MRLIPTHPPGRSTRKARDFETEIVQLRAQGYTLEAIRNALANAGVHVTISTVRREATRADASHRETPLFGPPATKARAAAPSPAATTREALPVASQVLPERRSGRDVAEDFMRNRITNPLIRSKEQR